MTTEIPQETDAPAMPRPRLKGGKPIIISCPMSEAQHAIQKDLVARYERLRPISEEQPATQEDLVASYELLRSGKVDPREDNPLSNHDRPPQAGTRCPTALPDLQGLPCIEDQHPGG